MFELAVPTIVGHRLNRLVVVSLLRDHAAKNGKVGRGMGAYVKYALARLDALTADDVDPYGITADEFNAWKRSYVPPPETQPAPPPADAPVAEPSAEPGPAEKRVLVGPAVPVSSAATKLATDSRSSAASTPERGEVELPFSGGPDLVKVMQAVNTGKLFNHALTLGKSLLTWRRVAVVLVWAIAMRWLVLQQGIPSTLSVLAMIPAAGIPWLLYRWRDRARQKLGFSVGEAAVVLLLGGWVGLWAARQLIGIALWLRYSLG